MHISALFSVHYFYYYETSMKHLNKTTFLFVAVCLAFLACGNGSNKGGMSPYKEMSAYTSRSSADNRNYAEADEMEEPAEASDATVLNQSRKLIKRADIFIRVEDPALTEQQITDLYKKYNAWPASTGLYDNSRNYVIRVPSDYYETMLNELTKLGKLLRRAENTEDATLRYYDLESRLNTKRELLKTYQSYLSKAKNIEEILSVESRIADLQREIDSTGTQFRNLVNLVDYSTISMQVDGPLNVVPYSKSTLKERLSSLFGSFGDVASSAIIVLVWIVIYGVPAVLLFILLFAVLFGRIGLLKKLMQIAAGKTKLSFKRGKKEENEVNSEL